MSTEPSTLRKLTYPLIQSGKHLIQTVALLFVAFVIAVAIIAITGDPGPGFFVTWGLGTVIVYRLCRHHVF